MLFIDLLLSEPILRAVAAEGYTTPTPVQAQAIPPVLEGRDVLGCAQTGTGKTAAFALPILHRLSSAKHPGPRPAPARCLVLCPTRELATQISESFRTYGRHLGLRHAVIFGGVGQNPQVDALRRGVDVIVATPGRLMDLMQQGHVDLRRIETLVLDEADRMLDMGFIDDIRRIVAKLPTQRQTLLFSATMPPEIRHLANGLLHNPATVQVAPAATTAAGIDESVYFVERTRKPVLLAHLVNQLGMARALVFTRTKHGADRVVRQLHQRGIRAEAIHGNKTQNARQRALDNFRANKTPVLVATDIASRGIDVDGITHVVNYDLTHEPETYIHRIGRTARAGAMGAAVSFCDHEEVPSLRAIERLIRRPIPVKTHDLPREAFAAAVPAVEPQPAQRRPTRGPARPHHQHAKSASHAHAPGNAPAHGSASKNAQPHPPKQPGHGGRGAGAGQPSHTTGQKPVGRTFNKKSTWRGAQGGNGGGRRRAF